MFEFAAGDNVKTTPQLCELLQDRKISVGFHRETNRVWNLSETAVELSVSISKGRAAIKISGSAKQLLSSNEVDALAKNVLNIFSSCGLLPCKLWREFGWVDKLQFFAGNNDLRAHRTFKTTSVRSSESGAPCENQSTSRKSTSASSVALTS